MVTHFSASESRTFSDDSHAQQFSQEMEPGRVGVLLLTAESRGS